MNLNNKVLLLQVFNHVMSLAAITYAIYISEYHWFLLAMISWFVIGPVSMVITMHRLLSHRSFKTYPWLENTLSFLTTFSSVGPTISWVAVHRMHHANAESRDDPHSPNKHGKISLRDSIKVWFLYDLKISAPNNFAKDLVRKPLHRWLFKNYFKIIFVASVILILIDPMLWLFLYVIPSCMTLHLLGTVNVIGHWHGYRSYETNDLSRNSWIVNLISLGDGWHNNHHAKPHKSHQGEKWWEWDLMGSIIKLIRI